MYDYFSKRQCFVIVSPNSYEQCSLNIQQSCSQYILNIFKTLKEKMGFEHPFDYADVKRIKTNCAMGKDGFSEIKDYFSSYE